MNQVLDKAFVKLLARPVLQVDSRYGNSTEQPQAMMLRVQATALHPTGRYIDLFNDCFYPTRVNIVQNMLINLQKCGENHGQRPST